MGEVAKILVYGDIHLSSRNYGAHLDYAEESLFYFKKITETAIEKGATHIVGTGDLTYGRFNVLEFRSAVEEQLKKQMEITKGNRYELKGNHDVSTSGMTEYEFYVGKGLLKPSTHIQVGNANISMIDYGKHEEVDILPVDSDKVNVVIAHDYFKFESTPMPEFGNFTNLDNFERWYGVDHILLGHIHAKNIFGGHIMKEDKSHEALVHILGCMPRPSYREGHVDKTADMVLMTVYDDDSPMNYEIIEVELWDLEKSFNLGRKEKETLMKEFKSQRLNIEDIVEELDQHKRNVGNPEDIIASLKGVEEKYKNKAIQLLKDGLN